MKRIFCFDFDGTLFETEGTDYSSSKPILSRIARVNELAKAGHKIILFTARGSKTGIDWSNVTEKQALDAGLIFDELLFGKPAADHYIDDKGISDSDFFGPQSKPAA